MQPPRERAREGAKQCVCVQSAAWRAIVRSAFHFSSDHILAQWQYTTEWVSNKRKSSQQQRKKAHETNREFGIYRFNKRWSTLLQPINCWSIFMLRFLLLPFEAGRQAISGSWEIFCWVVCAINQHNAMRRCVLMCNRQRTSWKYFERTWLFFRRAWVPL